MKGKTYFILALALSLSLAAAGAQADTFVGSSAGAWVSLPTVGPGGIDNTPPPFFDNPSWDGTPPGNLGYVLQNGTYSIPPLSYWSLNGGLSADPNVSFISTSSAQTELLFAIAGNASSNTLYIYNIANPSQTLEVFAGGTSTSTTMEVVVPSTWSGYGYELVGPGGTFYSTTGPAGSSTGNFAFLAPTGFLSSTGTIGEYTSNTWYIGVEDLPLGSSDQDYQDMVFSVTTDPPVVPLPPTALLLGMGLLGMILMGRRRQKV